jgi:hypothetical protein
MHDPRKGVRISERDIAALTFIGEGYEVAQYQLHAAIFPNVSAVVVSHFVTRAVRNGWIAVERWNRVGINRLRLTSAGRDVAVHRGVDPMSLFVPKRPVAMKDMAHTLWINDLRVALSSAGAHFDRIIPAWQLQRRMMPAAPAIPDVLAISKGRVESDGFIIACEIDLGSERLSRVFMPKLIILQAEVRQWGGSGESKILVLTNSSHRAAIINNIVRMEQLAIVAVCLPKSRGLAAISDLEDLVHVITPRTIPDCASAKAN